MVRVGKKAMTLPGQLLYSEEDTKAEAGKVVSQYQLDTMHLAAEPDKCHRELSEIRDLVLRCMRVHTELYLMGQEFDKYIQNIQLLKTNIPLLSEEKGNITNLTSLEAFYKGCTFSNTGLIVGTMGGLVVGGILSSCLLNYLSCATCQQAIWNAMFMKGCTTCLLKCGSVLAVSSLAFGLCSLVGLMTGVALGIGSDRRNVFENIHQFRIELESKTIKPDLTTMCQQLETVKEGLKSDLNATSNGSKSILELNILMKAYRDYRRAYEEARADPDNQGMSDEQLHRTIRKYGASVCIKPVMDQLTNFSKSETWELIDAIHQMVTRE